MNKEQRRKLVKYKFTEEKVAIYKGEIFQGRYSTLVQKKSEKSTKEEMEEIKKKEREEPLDSIV